MRETRTSGLTSGDRKRSHVSPDCGGGTKVPPMTHREANATAPVLDSTDVAEAQAEEVIQPDSVADDLGREAVPRVGGGLGRHLVILT
jgi:hypothetical protein